MSLDNSLQKTPNDMEIALLVTKPLRPHSISSSTTMDERKYDLTHVAYMEHTFGTKFVITLWIVTWC